MSQSYKAVGWNRQKKLIDSMLGGGVLLYLLVFMGLGKGFHPEVTPETLIIRGVGTAALILLHIILAIGPLCRLDARWLPLLYNRRHLGVTMFILALLHGVFALMLYHGYGNTPPLVSLFTANTRFDSLADFPFQPLGFFALVILFLMAATSHDFWLAQLTPPIWKALHMGVYFAYVLIVGHVALGFLQTETSPLLVGMMAFGVLLLSGLHLAAARQEVRRDREGSGTADPEGFVPVCHLSDLQPNRGFIVFLAGDRVAIFLYDGKVSAISNACAHQNGPLGEGRVIDGLVTCPWHGYQYDPASGASPPPFEEKVPTFNLKVREGQVWLHPCPNPAGTFVEPARLA